MKEPCLISLIVAVAQNGVIGTNNGIPWKCSSDMKYFRKTTMGKVVIMGRKTWESIGKPLKGRENIVLTRDPSYSAQGVHIVTSGPDALNKAGSLCVSDERCEVMIIGGKAIYDEFFELSERIYYTAIHMSAKGDTTFLDLSQLIARGWSEISRVEQLAGERDEANMTFVVLEKVKNPRIEQ
ncbi:MAG: dihydrofolate reductase [bacterium]|nr:dihydrofolate reductase [bacterium]